MLTTVVLVLLALVAAVLIFAATRPDTFRIERSASVNAPPERVFALINDYQNWRAWSPYERLDPDMKRSYGASSSGKGATYAWEGNKKIGKGRMEILESVPPSKIAIKLDFEAPFKAHNIAEFTLTPKDGATDVTWAMHGPAPFMNKVIGLFMNIDKMVGGQFAEGLANMKREAEKQRAASA